MTGERPSPGQERAGAESWAHARIWIDAGSPGAQLPFARYAFLFTVRCICGSAPFIRQGREHGGSRRGIRLFFSRLGRKCCGQSGSQETRCVRTDTSRAELDKEERRAARLSASRPHPVLNLFLVLGRTSESGLQPHLRSCRQSIACVRENSGIRAPSGVPRLPAPRVGNVGPR